MIRRTLSLLALAASIGSIGSIGCIGAVSEPDDLGNPGAGGPDAGDPGDDPGELPGLRAAVGPTGGIGLNLRAGPSLDAEVLAVMPDRAVLEVLGEPEAPFVPVAYLGQAGFAHEDFLALYGEDELPDFEPGFNFLLPWPDGVDYPVTQGHNQGSHVGMGAWAWDFGIPEGAPIHAAHAGVVRRARGDSQRGGCDPAYANDANYVTLDRGDGLETTYVHLYSVAVAVGDTVERGQLLGTSGRTGWACGAHLHFQVQISPSGGGGTSGYNQSVQAYFWDTGAPVDPPPQTRPTSRNGSADIP